MPPVVLTGDVTDQFYRRQGVTAVEEGLQRSMRAVDTGHATSGTFDRGLCKVPCIHESLQRLEDISGRHRAGRWKSEPSARPDLPVVSWGISTMKTRSRLPRLSYAREHGERKQTPERFNQPRTPP